MLYIKAYSNSQEISPYHVYHPCYSLMPFAFMVVKNNFVFEFLGMTMVGSMVYFNLTIFLRIQLLSKMKSDDLSTLILFTLFYRTHPAFFSLCSSLRLTFVVCSTLLAFTLVF